VPQVTDRVQGAAAELRHELREDLKLPRLIGEGPCWGPPALAGNCAVVTCAWLLRALPQRTLSQRTLPRLCLPCCS